MTNNTIMSIVKQGTSTKDLLKFFADLWEEAERYGFFVDDEEMHINETFYDGWVITDEHAFGFVTFEDPMHWKVTLKHTGTKYTDLKFIVD